MILKLLTYSNTHVTFQCLNVSEGRYEKIPLCFKNLNYYRFTLLRRNMIMNNVLLQLVYQIPSLLCTNPVEDQKTHQSQ
jgi:hypothetical protein